MIIFGGGRRKTFAFVFWGKSGLPKNIIPKMIQIHFFSLSLENEIKVWLYG